MNPVPVLALLPGDPCGIGPEITARYLAQTNLPPGVRLAVPGTHEELDVAAAVAGGLNVVGPYPAGTLFHRV